ncbi:MAG: HD family phosphohydrolase [Prevotella sp.]|jgi:putative nucleotidyltransferase with HDIG domain
MNVFSHINNRPEHYWRNIAGRVALVIVTVAIIVSFLPKQKTQQFVYKVGEPWQYGTIIAKFDFPIYKSETALDKERDSLLRYFQPYYSYDSSVESKAIKRFREDFAAVSPDVPEGTEEVIVDRLHRLYQAGIMTTPEYNSIRRDTTSMIRVIFGKNAESIQINCIYSTMSAYEQLLTDEVLSRDRIAMQHLNLNNYIEPNLVYDRNRTETARDDLLSGITYALGVVKAGQRIISTGDIVTPTTARMLYSFEKEVQRRLATSTQQITTNTIGDTLYVLILVSLFTIFLALFRKDYFEKPRAILMIYLWLIIFPVLVSLMMEHNYFHFSVYVLPFAIAPVFVRVFMDSRTAFMTHITMVLLCAAALRFQYEFIVIQTVAGMVAILSMREMQVRAQVFRTALFVFVACCLSFYTLKLMSMGSEFNMGTNMFTHFLISGVLLLLAYPLMYLVEKTFGFTSVITLIELSNTNKGLLRNLSETAPGTFMHSITVANLAAEIANRIGANSTLVRTGALYHDIGKMENPGYFTENQEGSESPFDNLTERESAQIIIRHVTYGVKLAEEAGLPVEIRDFILTHHGRGMAKYFYIKYQNQHPDEVVDKDPFTYPGPNPSTREQAILMMSDTCEAASHSLKDYTEESISQMVNTLIDGQVDAGFFRECKITFYDIAVAKQVLIERLKAIYHTRIAYPKSKVKEKDKVEKEEEKVLTAEKSTE